MAPDTPNDAPTTDAITTQSCTLAQESAGRPAFVVDADGAVVWAGPLARRLIDAGGLEAASAATLARLASSRAATMARLRFGALGRAAPVVVRTRPVAEYEGRRLLAVEALSAIDPDIEFDLADPEGGAAKEDATATVAATPEAEAVQASRSEIVFDEDALPGDDRLDHGWPDETPLVADARDLDSVSERTEHAERDDDGPDAVAPALVDAIAFSSPGEDFSPPPDAELGALRFVFETDAERRIAFLSPDLAAVVGPSARAAVGRGWSDVAQALDLDPAGAVEAALGGPAAWNDLSVSWPMADGRRLPLNLSALPMFDRARALAGFRGLGRATGAPVPSAAPEAGPATGVEAETIEDIIDYLSGDEPTGDDAPDGAAADRTAASSTASEPAAGGQDGPDPADERDPSVEPEDAVLSEPPPISRLLGQNVVTLRETAPPLLTTSEESAFDEIARRLRDLGVRTSASPYGDGEAAREPWMINDVDARLAAGARSDELLRLLDRLPVGAVALKHGAVVYANRNALDLLGHADLGSLAERDAGTLFAEPLPHEGDAAPATLRLLARDGVEVEAEARLSAIFWEGEPATLVSLRRAEGAVEAARAAIEREKETAAILDTATDGVLTLDGAGRILSVNRSAEALFGFEARDVVGSLFTLSLAPESRKTAFDYLDRLRLNGVAAVMNDGREVLGLARQGGAIPLYMTIGRIGAHEADRFCAVLRDITPWKKAEEELLAAKRQAERASAQKSEFLTKVSREIRTPLNAIIGFAEVMMEERFGPVGSPRYKDYLRDIHVSGGHLVGLVNDLVDIARVESGGVKLDPSPVDLNEIAQQAAALLQPQASRDHVIIRASLARGLPPVMADRRSVRQIMTTLAANAVKLSRPGGQVIVATAITDLGQAVIRVRDAGAGLSKQELATALEPFRPLGSGEGRGLALPLAKALAEANEATLTLTSEPGQGTLAEVVFPAVRVLAG